MRFLWIFLLAFSASWILTGLLRRYALSKSLIDIPNVRSSHSIPTPRGGGVAVVITFLVALVILWLMSFLEGTVVLALMGSGLLISIIGFIDDHGHIAARWRLISHFTAAVWVVFWLGGMPPFMLFGVELDIGLVGELFAVVAIVWLLNLYNFMDGIDGIAGIEALSVTIVAGMLMFHLSKLEGGGMVTLNILLLSAVVGFLVWNFPPAKVFMGDAGSGFIGLMLGSLALYSTHLEQQMLWVWSILLGVFIVDATYTLVRRLLRGDKVYEAHRSHAYQYASRKFESHKLVTLSVLMINIFWLTPWASLVALGFVDGSTGLLLAYIPLLGVAWYFRAGELEING